MSNSFLSKRYARAYDGVAKTNDEARVNLQVYVSALDSLREAAGYLNNPVISFDVKQELISKIILSGKAADFIKLLILKKRFSLARNIAADLQNLLDLRLGVKRVNIISADEMTQKQKKRLEETLENFFKSKVVLNYAENKSLLGGIQIRQADELIDATALSRIKQMSRVLSVENTDTKTIK
jgi:F-type H+-transporting ATPase subunit delta